MFTVFSEMSFGNSRWLKMLFSVPLVCLLFMVGWISTQWLICTVLVRVMKVKRIRVVRGLINKPSFELRDSPCVGDKASLYHSYHCAIGRLVPLCTWRRLNKSVEHFSSLNLPLESFHQQSGPEPAWKTMIGPTLKESDTWGELRVRAATSRSTAPRYRLQSVSRSPTSHLRPTVNKSWRQCVPCATEDDWATRSTF